ncbi:MAG: hypothetical protein QOE76_2963 [Frankiales bacterium]|nr:hypothetical protein [Frankiales bacterium]
MSVPTPEPTPPAAMTSAAVPGIEQPAPPLPTPTRPDLTLPRRAADGPRPATLSTQELRFAMAFTGGVSLAIWMGGIAREVDLLIQASDRRQTGAEPEHPADTPDEDPVRRFYRRILDLVDVQVAVDVLSGTSAGGINAALLGMASAQRVDLSSLRDTWLDVGSLSQLLRDPREANPPSLLKGDGQLLSALSTAIAAIRGDAPATTDPRTTDVFITTTYLSPENSRFADDWGTQIVDSDHHGQFYFDENALVQKESVPALALASRSSASFPCAFEPSYVPVDEAGLAGTHPDMADFSNATRSHWAADGGLLVNRPIAPLLQSIFDRGADREVRRALLYVVPTAASPRLPEPDAQHRPLGLAEALVRDLEATLNQSIAADLAAIREHNDRTRSASDTRLRLAGLGRQLPDGVRLADQDAWDDYRQRQGDWLIAPLVAELSRQCSVPGRWPAEWQPAAAASRDSTLRALCKAEATAGWPALLPADDTAAEGAAALGRSAYDNAKATILRVMRLGFTLASTTEDRAALCLSGSRIHTGFTERRATDLRQLVSRSLAASSARHRSLHDAVADLACSYGKQQGEASALKSAWAGLASVGAEMAPLLTRLAADGLAGAAAAAGSVPSSTGRRRWQAAVELKTYLDFLCRGDLVRQLLDLHVVVRSVLPVLVEVEQPVQLIQVSSDTRTLLADKRSTAASKLTGLQFHHFGAFYKTSWRANDWMWGRLDGCGWLVHILLDPRRILTVLEDEGVGIGARAQTFERGLLSALDLPSGAALTPELRESLAFLDDEDKAVPRSLPAVSMWAAEVLQRHIAGEELRCVAAHMRSGTEGEPSAPGRAWLADFDEKNKLPDETARRNAVANLLRCCPVPAETLDSQRRTPLFLRTVTRSIAVATAAGTAMKDTPASLRPTFATARSITHTAYLATDRTGGKRRTMTFAGAGLLTCGVLAMLSHTVWLGLPGLVMFGAGALLLALCVGRTMVSVLQVVVALGVVLVAAAPWLPFLSDHLYTWLDRSLVPWLHRERWAWPVIVLLVLIPPATTIFGWLRGRASGSGHPIPSGARAVTAGEQLQVAYPAEPALPAQDKATASRSVVAT